ncbi:hypothetical protein AURDEDRAFT_171086 [Auricularia subglabra TFB-10046 SS5]|nr:hypothetical protein AURDEDRAFT_171086 [Auricularia subglabra TFB-10046 SS5]
MNHEEAEALDSLDFPAREVQSALLLARREISAACAVLSAYDAPVTRLADAVDQLVLLNSPLIMPDNTVEDDILPMNTPSSSPASPMDENVPPSTSDDVDTDSNLDASQSNEDVDHEITKPAANNLTANPRPIVVADIESTNPDPAVPVSAEKDLELPGRRSPSDMCPMDSTLSLALILSAIVVLIAIALFLWNKDDSAAARCCQALYDAL